jgi:hypothetical protein
LLRPFVCCEGKHTPPSACIDGWAPARAFDFNFMVGPRRG